jgi:3-oxoisoapionate kinase
MNNLLLSFYGDDFTGSTDAMEALVLGGVPTVLFLKPPTAEFIAQHYPNIRALGVAGVSRSMSPAQMDQALPSVFEAIKSLNAPVFHYKICSTFDSSPVIGSIGRAIDIGWQVFQSRFVPLMVGAPALKRYVAFGNLFATIGDDTFRLDRHPTMSRHPITPMDESDLRLHLVKQTDRPIGLVDLRHLAEPEPLIMQRINQLVEAGTEIMLFDTVDQEHLLKIGQLIWSLERDARFVVASSGLEYALTAYWQRSGLIERPEPIHSPGAVPQLAVITGSASPQTAAQIEWAIEHNFHGIRLDSPALIDPNTADTARHTALEEASRALADGRSVILFSTIGPTDEAITVTRNRMQQLGIDPNEVGSRLGAQQGILLRELLTRTRLRRVCVAGGDTCGHVVNQLDIHALEYLMPIAPGAPLCRARSEIQQFDGLEISLKAGQVGKADYFGSIQNGGVSS